jgi:hypothetical protein
MGTRFGDVWNTICVTHLAKKALLSFLLPFKLPNGMVDGCRKKRQKYKQSLQNYNLFKYLLRVHYICSRTLQLPVVSRDLTKADTIIASVSALAKTLVICKTSI